jgi:chloride channel protein, CIC family
VRKPWLSRLLQNENNLAFALSLIIGALVGLVVVAFILLTGRLAARMYPAGGAPWRRVLVPALGSLVTGFLLYRYFPFARGSGIPQTKFALFIEDGRIRFRTVVGKFLCCSASLASGIALGREGPSVQIGAGLASVIGRRLGLGKEQVKMLIPVGGAAALAAAFNTPIAAVLFSLEEIVGDLHAPVLGTVVLSSATAWMVLHLVLGDEPLFHVGAYHLVNPVEFFIYAILGVAGGLASVAFVKLLLGLRAWFKRLPRSTAWMQPTAGGLAVGIMGWFVPEVLGVGYNYVERVLNGDMVLKMVLLLVVLKICATAICYASGNAGGIFGPSLFIGALTGGAVGSIAHALFPAYTAEPGAYALVGMGTAFAGIVRTPMTSVIMIFEMTRDYTIIVPLMISNMIAFLISLQFQRDPIYEALAHQDGVHLPSGVESRRDQGGVRIAQVMRPAPEGLPPQLEVAQAAVRARKQDVEACTVADQHGFWGMIPKWELEGALARGGGARKLSELLGGNAAPDSEAARKLPHVHPDHAVATALERMGASGYNVLPVVSRVDVRRLEGIVTLDDILEAYRVKSDGVRPDGEKAEERAPDGPEDYKQAGNR